MQRRLFLVFAATALVGLFAIGCTPDVAPGSQLAGQECTEDSDCASDLVCVERRCRSVSDSGDTDAGDNGDVGDAGGLNDNGAPDDIDPDDTGTDPDPSCTPGETRCDGTTRVERCIGASDGSTHWTSNSCPTDHSCSDGSCVDESSSPGDCCEGGCGSGEICHDCSCTSYDPDECEYQNQPCSTEGQIENGFGCAPYGDEDGSQFGLRCLGLCTPSASAPDETCPEQNSVCMYEDTSQPTGHCTTNCSIGDHCTDDWLTCIYNDSAYDDGICLPVTDTNQIGDSCDSADIYSCAGEGICIGGFCQQSCRPFDKPQTDCASGHCLAFNSDMGMCAQDSSLGSDGECSAAFTTCGEDATGCFPDDLNDPQPTDFSCHDVCRLALGDDDCSGDQSCEQHDPDNTDVGYCV